MRVPGKVAIVTGAAQGIGQGYAEVLAREGAKVALVDIRARRRRRTQGPINAGGGETIGIRTDLTDAAEVDAMVAAVTEHFGGIDILVNNAARYAGYVHYSLMETPMDYWRSFFEINVDAVLRTSQAVVPSMIERGKGKIIMQSSAGGTSAGNVYGLTKLTVQGLTVGLARELGKHRICVNCIAPGVVPTQATKDHYPGEQLHQLVERLHSIKRLASVEDMAPRPGLPGFGRVGHGHGPDPAHRRRHHPDSGLSIGRAVAHPRCAGDHRGSSTGAALRVIGAAVRSQLAGIRGHDVGIAGRYHFGRLEQDRARLPDPRAPDRG